MISSITFALNPRFLFLSFKRSREPSKFGDEDGGGEEDKGGDDDDDEDDLLLLLFFFFFFVVVLSFWGVVVVVVGISIVFWGWMNEWMDGIGEEGGGSSTLPTYVQVSER